MSSSQLKEHIKALINHDEATEYVSDDGCICCKVCGKPKQFIPIHRKTGVMWGWADPWPCLCDCQTGDEDLRQIIEKRLADLTGPLRKDCFGASRYAQATFDASEPGTEAYRYCRNYADNFREIRASGVGVLLYGAVGTGKTHLAACIANAVIGQGGAVKATRISEISDAITSSYGKSGGVLGKLAGYDLVLIDDLGTERQDERTAERAYLAINALYDANVPMVITTNLPLAGMRLDTDGIRQRIYSRILGQCVPVEVKGKDRRGDDSRIKQDKVRAIMLGKGR